MVRFAAPEMATIIIDNHYLTYFSNTEISPGKNTPVSVPEMKFAEIKIPVEKVIPVKIRKVLVKEAQLPMAKVLAESELPFHEPVVLQKVVFENETMTNLVALYQEIQVEEVASLAAEEKNEVKEEVIDEVTSTQASPEKIVASASKAVIEENADSSFFEYPTEDEELNKVAVAPTDASSVAPVSVANIQTASQLKQLQAPEPAIAVSEEVAVNDLIAFDYSKAQAGIANQTVPTVSAVTTQPKHLKSSPGAPSPKPNRQDEQDNSGKSNKNALTTPSYPVEMSIQASSTNLKTSRVESGFELRFLDDRNESLMDSVNDGEVIIQEVLSQPKMTRAVTLIKMGFAPTHSEIILSNDPKFGTLDIPLIDDEVFGERMNEFDKGEPIGAVLVELDNSTDVAQLDVPFGKVILLDGEMRETESEDFRYQLFLGVKAGNALLTYKGFDKKSIGKIIHVHAESVTYESNHLEVVEDEEVKLVEEDLLSREPSPLIISSEQVKIFATNKNAKKINDHTYQLDFSNSLNGARRYLELNHQLEPVFLGIRNTNQISVPSESFMRHILSNLDSSKLANRCVVQVNLRKKISKVDVDSESIEDSVRTYSQMLDADGKFYDSAGDKTRKVIVVGEHTGSEQVSKDAKINIKVTYQDDTVEYLNSYCSPNTYLVEQL